MPATLVSVTFPWLWQNTEEPQKRKGLFWITAWDISSHDHLAPLMLGVWQGNRHNGGRARGSDTVPLLAAWTPREPERKQPGTGHSPERGPGPCPSSRCHSYSISSQQPIKWWVDKPTDAISAIMIQSLPQSLTSERGCFGDQDFCMQRFGSHLVSSCDTPPVLCAVLPSLSVPVEL